MPDTRFDRGIPDDQQAIRLHDGWVMSATNEVDNRMTQVGTWLTDRDLSDASRPEWASYPQHERRRRIARLFPKDWRDGQMLVDRTQKLFEYRNVIGHGTVAFRFEDDTVIWERRSTSGVVQIVVSEIPIWESRLAVVGTAWKLLVYPGIPMMRDLNLGADKIGLPTLVLEDRDVPGIAESAIWSAAHRWVFPPSK